MLRSALLAGLLTLTVGASTSWGAQLVYRPQERPEAATRAVATADARPLVTAHEMNEAMTPMYLDMARRIHARQQEWLRWFIETQLLAQQALSRKLAVDALLRGELKADPAKAAEWDAARRAYVERLWEQAKVSIEWPAPEAPRPAGSAGTATAELVYSPRTPSEQSMTAVAKAHGHVIVNLRDFNDSMSVAYYEIASTVYRRQVEWLEATVGERLLRREAERRGTTTEAVLRLEAPGDGAPPATGRREYVERLRREARVSIGLPEPKRPLVTASQSSGGPVLGGDDAPISVIEFCTFTSPECRTAWEILRQAVRHYGWRIRIAHREHIPAAAGQAMMAAVAARCAHRQQKFWPYHEMLYANQERLGDREALKGFARTLDLDQPAFDRCLDRGEPAEEIGWDLLESRRLGLTALPSLFVNSTYIGGVHPLPELIKLLDMLAIQ